MKRSSLSLSLLCLLALSAACASDDGETPIQVGMSPGAAGAGGNTAGASPDAGTSAPGPQSNGGSATGSVTSGGGTTPPASGSSGPSAGGTTRPDAGAPAMGTGSSDAGAPSAGDAGKPAQSDAAAPSQGGSNLAPTEAVDKDGPYAPTHITNGGARGSSWVFYPMDLGKGGVKHPVFNWGPGAGTGPSQYTDHLNRLASHGFVVISQPSSGTGTDEKAALDWLLAQNDKADSPFYQKLDTKRVGAGGHSLGSLTTMKMAADPRLTTYILVCGGCMSGSGGCGAKDIHGPTVILGGDTDIGTPNFEADYKEITQPVVFLTKSGTDHIACARNNLAPWVAFMRWHLAGEAQWKPKFLDGGEYCKSPWMCKSKGF